MVCYEQLDSTTRFSSKPALKCQTYAIYLSKKDNMPQKVLLKVGKDYFEIEFPSNGCPVPMCKPWNKAVPAKENIPSRKQTSIREAVLNEGSRNFPKPFCVTSIQHTWSKAPEQT